MKKNFKKIIRNIFYFLHVDKFLTFFLRVKSNKMDGISICVRINQDKYIDILFEQMNNIYSFVGEILIHYNGINDEKKLIEKSRTIPNCILKKYESENLDINKYTNDFIDEMKYKWFFSFDCDFIFDKEMLIKFLQKIQKSKKNIVYFLSGINILRDLNGNIGFSDCSHDSSHIIEECNYKFQFTSFVGWGDIVCYVPYYTHKVKKYWKNEKESIYQWLFYKRKFTGLTFLHLSWMHLPIKKVYSKIDFKLIWQNIKDNPDKYVVYCYKNMINNTTIQTLDILMQLMHNHFNYINENL